MPAFKDKKNGSWYVQFRYTDWQGQRKQKLKRGFTTKRDALEWERQFLMQKRADVNMTFESFVQLYENDVRPKLKENTWLSKESVIKSKILPYFKERKLCEISAKDVIDWQNEIRKMKGARGTEFSKCYLKTISLTCSVTHSLCWLSTLIRFFMAHAEPLQNILCPGMKMIKSGWTTGVASVLQMVR